MSTVDDIRANLNDPTNPVYRDRPDLRANAIADFEARVAAGIASGDLPAPPKETFAEARFRSEFPSAHSELPEGLTREIERQRERMAKLDDRTLDAMAERTMEAIGPKLEMTANPDGSGVSHRSLTAAQHMALLVDQADPFLAGMGPRAKAEAKANPWLLQTYANRGQYLTHVATERRRRGLV